MNVFHLTLFLFIGLNMIYTLHAFVYNEQPIQGVNKAFNYVFNISNIIKLNLIYRFIQEHSFDSYDLGQQYDFDNLVVRLRKLKSEMDKSFHNDLEKPVYSEEIRPKRGRRKYLDFSTELINH